MRTYTFISSDECSGGLTCRVEGPESPSIIELYEEFIRVSEFPVRDFELGGSYDFRTEFDKHLEWLKKFSARDVTSAFAAWLVSDRGFSLLPDDSVHFCNDGPRRENGVLTRIPYEGSYENLLRKWREEEEPES